MPGRHIKQDKNRRSELLGAPFLVLIVIGTALGLVLRRRETKALTKLGSELGEITGQRWRESDARADRLIALTERLSRLTWAVLALTGAAVLVAVVSLISA